MAAIYFDVDGTLLQFDRPFDRIVTLACERVAADEHVDIGVSQSGARESIYGTYTEAFFDAFEALSSDPYREGARAAITKHDLNADPTTLAEAIQAVERESTTVAAGVREAMAALDGDHRLGILSNGIGDVQRAKLAYHGLEDHFEAEIVSHDLGVLKPGPEIFTIARDRLDADRYVYIADDLDDDVRPANELGFETVRVVADAEDEVVAAAEDEGPAASPADYRIRFDEFERIVDIL